MNSDIDVRAGHGDSDPRRVMIEAARAAGQPEPEIAANLGISERHLRRIAGARSADVPVQTPTATSEPPAGAQEPNRRDVAATPARGRIPTERFRRLNGLNGDAEMYERGFTPTGVQVLRQDGGPRDLGRIADRLPTFGNAEHVPSPRAARLLFEDGHSEDVPL